MRGLAEAVRAELAHERSRVHLTTVYPPSVNTPFYSHSIARINGLPRPPPPIYQPEVMANAIYCAATSRRRDVLVGGQTVAAALLAALAPELADRVLVSRSCQRVLTARDENVFTPLQDVAAVHGPFDGEALSSSVQLWITKNRGIVATGLGLFSLLALALSPRVPDPWRIWRSR